MLDRENPQNGASVVVCCHNSASRIGVTVEHLARQNVRPPWEVVLVNNHCTDNTVVAAEKTWREHGAPAPLRVVDEPQLGLSFARAAGISQATHEIIVFCDDDNWLDSQYVQRAVDIMHARPDVGVLGGQAVPVADVELPGWFWTYAAGYAVGAPALDSGDVTKRGYVCGAGMVLRRSVYQQMGKCGARHLLTDRTGTTLSSGGDYEICMWHVLAGYRLWYDEGLVLKHFIPKERLTKEYCGHLQEGFCDQTPVFTRYHLMIAALEMKNPLARLARFCSGAVRSVFGSQRGRWIAQAYGPPRGIVFDRATQQIQRFARSIQR